MPHDSRHDRTPKGHIEQRYGLHGGNGDVKHLSTAALTNEGYRGKGWNNSINGMDFLLLLLILLFAFTVGWKSYLGGQTMNA